jgi:hypothetical protein
MSSPNPHFNNFGSTAEQSLLEDLIIESIKIHGQNMYWLPRILQGRSSGISTSSVDPIFGEDTLSEFWYFFQIPIYIKNIEGFEGEGDFISRFGLEIRDQITFTMAKKTFDLLNANQVAYNDAYSRPREGDLIFMPLNNKFFEIMHVEHESLFYPAGTLPVYDLRCELYRYSSEKFDLTAAPADLAAGVAAVTAQSQEVTLDTEASMPSSSTVDNKAIEDEADSILDFDESNPFGSF